MTTKAKGKTVPSGIVITIGRKSEGFVTDFPMTRLSVLSYGEKQSPEGLISWIRVRALDLQKSFMLNTGTLSKAFHALVDQTGKSLTGEPAEGEKVLVNESFSFKMTNRELSAVPV